ncbi:MAG: hypothetical protein C4K60_21305 [Ideonella sp. MAG2]|nr:MAG: hypothetical protein C4K60_21305 [Ideonella sp. MAG2]
MSQTISDTRPHYHFKPWNVGRWIIWGGFALVLLAAPLLWTSSLAQTMLSQMGIAIIVCLAYNMLLGQGGMLSFGHAVYSGLGAYLAIHALNKIGAGWWLPVSMVKFIGYSTRHVRYIAFILSGFFAGIGGGLSAINTEIVNAEVVGAARSGAYLLFVFLGGATFFFGPIIGAVLMVFALVLLSEWTQAWQLYLGLTFVLMVMYAPGGFAGLIMMNLRVASFGKLGKLWTAYLALGGAGMVVLMGASAMIEMVFHLQLNAALGAEVPFMGATLNALGKDAWVGSVFVVLTGVGLFEVARRQFNLQWGETQEEIEKEIKRRETL